MNTAKDDYNSIEAKAREWVLYLHSDAVEAARLAEFEAWVGADPAHARAYRDCEQLMGDLTLVEELAEIDLEPAPPCRLPPHRPRSFNARMLAPVAAFAAVLVLALAFALQLQPAAPTFATDVAQLRDITLPDGSLVTLGGRSRIATDFSDSQRHVTLLEGEAFFAVSKDPARPFYVAVGDRLIRVVGTQFDVRHGVGLVRVAVLEGVVEVLQAEAPAADEPLLADAPKQVLHAGEQVVALIGRPQHTRTAVEPGEAGAWRRGWLSYENASLAEIVADANRYSERQIVLDSESLRQLRLTAAFGADTVDQFIGGLIAAHPIEADYSQSGKVVLRHNP